MNPLSISLSDNYVERNQWAEPLSVKRRKVDFSGNSTILSLSDSTMEEDSDSFTFNDSSTYISPKTTKSYIPRTPFLKNRPKFDYLMEDTLHTNANPFTTPYRRRQLVAQSPHIIPLARDQSRYVAEFEENCILGTSQFGAVYKCEKRFDGISYAIKQIYITLPEIESTKIIERVKMLAKVTGLGDVNKHIVKYFNSWCEDKILYMQMELCDYSLDKLLQNQSFSEADVLKFMKHVLQGILYLRRHKYYCYTIEPSTIYLHNGIYKIGVLETHEIDTFYTPHHSINLPTYHEVADDIFSVGMIACEMMNGGKKLSITNINTFFMNPRYSIRLLCLCFEMVRHTPRTEEELKKILDTVSSTEILLPIHNHHKEF